MNHLTDPAVIVDAIAIVDAEYARAVKRATRRNGARAVHFTQMKSGSCRADSHDRATCPGHATCSTFKHAIVTRDPTKVTCRACIQRLFKGARA